MIGASSTHDGMQRFGCQVGVHQLALQCTGCNVPYCVRQESELIVEQMQQVSLHCKAERAKRVRKDVQRKSAKAPKKFHSFICKVP
eukprot:1296619-Amphidinium_carterae.3